MSYLRGPLTRSQVRELVKDQRAALLGQATAPAAAPAAAAPSTPQPAVAPAAPAMAAALGLAAPGLPADVPQVYLPARRSMYQALGDLEARLGSKLNVAWRQAALRRSTAGHGHGQLCGRPAERQGAAERHTAGHSTQRSGLAALGRGLAARSGRA